MPVKHFANWITALTHICVLRQGLALAVICCLSSFVSKRGEDDEQGWRWKNYWFLNSRHLGNWRRRIRSLRPVLAAFWFQDQLVAKTISQEKRKTKQKAPQNNRILGRRYLSVKIAPLGYWDGLVGKSACYLSLMTWVSSIPRAHVRVEWGGGGQTGKTA